MLIKSPHTNGKGMKKREKKKEKPTVKTKNNNFK